MARILLITNLYPPQELGGYGRCMSDFCWGLKNRGHKVEVLTSDAPYLGPSSQHNNTVVHRDLKLKGSYNNGITFVQDKNLCSTIDKENNDALLSVVKKGWDSMLIGNIDLIGPELLLTVVSLGLPIVHHIGFTTPPFQWIFAQLNQKNYKVAGASKAVCQSLTQAGFPVTKMTVIYPGAREDLLGESFTGRRLPAPLNGWIPQPPRLGTSKEPLKLCFAGLIIETKGVHTLIDALTLLKERGIHFQATIAGQAFQAGYKNKLKQRLKDCGIEGNVLFTGNLNREQLARMYILNHVGVFPSIYPEAFGIVAAEMQLSGLAVVTSGVGGAKELVHHGKTGLGFAAGNHEMLANCLQLLADDPQLLRQLAKNGQDQARKLFSVEKSCSQLEMMLR